jgi:putative restriction endonuclease
LDEPSLSLAEELQRAFTLFQPLIDVVSGRYSLGKSLLERDELLREVLGADKSDQSVPQNLVDARRKILATITQRQGQGPFRSDLLVAYRGSCAVTGTTAIEALEAAHIKPYAGPQTNQVNNGLLLRADIHTLFDLGLLTIGDDLSVVVSNKLSDSVYQALHGKLIALPTEENARPSLEAIRWHRSNRLGQST